MTFITSPFFVSEARALATDDIQTLFPSAQPLCLEVGCGTGDFIVQMATRHPERNFLAIDIFNQGCVKTCNRVEEFGLENVRVLRVEARFMISRILGRESLAAIYVNCPDPWPKKRHRKRRLVNPAFLKLALYSLVEGGEFHFSTDFVDYGIEAGEFLENEEGFTNCQDTPYSHDLGQYPISKYMRRFLDLGQPIYYCHFTRKPGYQMQELPEVQKGFRVRWAQG